MATKRVGLPEIEHIAIYYTMEKKEWGNGPWRDEPDKMQWRDAATGLPCLVKRNTAGALCGYVGVPEGHPWYMAGYDTPDVWVHGGLTYASLCQEPTLLEGEEGDPEAHTICHIPQPGEPDNVWWLGFDCAHGEDIMPAHEYRMRDIYAKVDAEMEARHPGSSKWRRICSYKTLAFVQKECQDLAEQITKAVT